MSSRETPYKWKKRGVKLAPELEAAVQDPKRKAGRRRRSPQRMPSSSTRGIGELKDTREEPVANLESKPPKAQPSRTLLGETQEADA